MIMGPLAQGGAPGGLLLNSGFEDGLTGWELAPDDADGGAIADVFPTLGEDSSAGLLILDETVVTQMIPVAGGEDFTITVNVETLVLANAHLLTPIQEPNTPYGGIVIEFLDLPWRTQTALDHGIYHGVDGDLSFSVTAPATADYLRIRLAGSAAVTAIVFDNVVVETA